MPIQMILADDHTITHDGLRLLLDAGRNIKVVGQVRSLQNSCTVSRVQKTLVNRA
jgi:hypothetical protein